MDMKRKPHFPIKYFRIDRSQLYTIFATQTVKYYLRYCSILFAIADIYVFSVCCVSMSVNDSARVADIYSLFINCQKLMFYSNVICYTVILKFPQVTAFKKFWFYEQFNFYLHKCHFKICMSLLLNLANGIRNIFNHFSI